MNEITLKKVLFCFVLFFFSLFFPGIDWAVYYFPDAIYFTVPHARIRPA